MVQVRLKEQLGSHMEKEKQTQQSINQYEFCQTNPTPITLEPPSSQHKKMVASSSSSNGLPHDLVFDIFTRLPAKSLIRFSCACKSWYSTITDRNFINTHLNHAKLLDNDNCDSDGDSDSDNYLLYMYSCVNLSSFKRQCTIISYHERTFAEVSRFEFPFDSAKIVGSCNGLVCVSNVPSRTLYLWNPSIRKFVMLTSTSLNSDVVSSKFNVALGFAYQSQNNDHRIVRLVFDEEFPPEVEVYSLSTDSWRRVGFEVESVRRIEHNISTFCLHSETSVFVNGALHWIAGVSRDVVDDPDHRVILVFDVNHEGFQEMMLPEGYLTGFEDPTYHLATFNGSLALIVFGEAEEDAGSEICCLWVMRKYGVVESWTKQIVPLRFVRRFFGCTKNGELIIAKFGSGLVSFDPNSLYEKELRIQGSPRLLDIATCMGSLVLLDRENAVSG